jgi:formate hydrogenlyase transcriptional activator
VDQAEPRERIADLESYWLRTWPRQYGFALLMVAVATSLRFALQLFGPFHSAFVLFYPAVVLVAMCAGFWPGLFATVLAAISGGYFFEEPRNTFAVHTAEDVVEPALFALVGLFLTVLTASRDRARHALAVSEAELNRAQAVAHMGSWHCDIESGALRLSDEACRIFGLPLAASISLQQARQMLHAQDRDRVDAAWQAPLNKGTYDDEVRVVADGRIRWVRVQAGMECDAEGRPTKAVGIVQDITARKRAEAELRESEDRYRDLVEHSEDLVCTHDLKGRLLTVNPACARILGYEVEELLKIPMRELIVPEGREAFDHYLERLRTTGQPERGWSYVMTRNGEVRTWEYYNTLRTEGVATPIVRGMAHDITEKRRAELALHESEQKFSKVFRQSPMSITLKTAKDHRYIEVNETFEHMTGWSRDEIIGRTPLDIGLWVDPVERLEVTQRLLTGGPLRDVETRFRTKDGSIRTASLTMDAVELNGETCVIAVGADITERKQAEEALREAKEFSEKLIQTANVIIVGLDTDGNVTLFNDAGEAITGYSLAELKGKSWSTLVPRDRFPQVWREFDRVVAGTAGRTFENPILTKTGEERYIAWQNSTVQVKGKVVATISCGNDITERKRAEDEWKKAEVALRQSEARFRLLVEHASDGIFISDSQGKYLDVNSAGAEMLGFTREEILERSIPDVIAPEEAPRVAPEAARLASNAIRSEWMFRRKDGSFFPGEVSGKRLPDGRLQAILRDMTERKRAEETLRESEQRMRLAQEVARIGTYDRDFISGETRWSPEMEAIYGVQSGNFPKSSERFLELIHPKDRQGVSELLQRSIESGGAQGEWRVVWPDGSVHWIAGRWRVFCDGNGKPMRAIGMDYDITERKRADEALRQSEERFRVALKDSPITVFNQDCDLRYTWLYNPRLHWEESVIGRTDEEILGAKKALRLSELKRRVLDTGAAVREEMLISHEGTNYAFEVTIEPLFDAEQKIVGITGVAMDVARLRELLDGLQMAKEKLIQEKSYLEGEIQEELGFEEIIGQNAGLRGVLKQARVVAATGSTVLLLGETGTGKELVARSIHSLSPRKDKNFIKLNCAAVPSGLLESELFGHEKGAFTGAVSQKAGRVELADKGTLFLDEIGELPLELQPKLLRVLQDREFERLGGVKTLKVDVRIISATNRDLRKDVAERKFREDLFYRLNVFPIQLPALRERRSDIPMLVRHFVQKHAVRMGKQIDTIPDGTLALLQTWTWPGNIRELENMIERMVILSRGTVLAEPPIELEAGHDYGEDTLTEMEREHIIRIMRETNGVLSGADGAASRLGIKRTTLQSMLKRFGIEPREYKRGAGPGPH